MSDGAGSEGFTKGEAKLHHGRGEVPQGLVKTTETYSQGIFGIQRLGNYVGSCRLERPKHAYVWGHVFRLLLTGGHAVIIKG